MKRDTTFLNNDFRDNDWLGIVVNNQDPTFAGRAQVRVFGVMDTIINEHLPWSSPVNSEIYGGDGGGSLSIPKLGQFVRIRFANGDLYSPEILAIQNIDSNLIETIKEDYEGAHVLAHDPEYGLSIIHQVQSGLLIFYKESFFQITPDSMITLQTEDAESLIQLEGDVTRIVTKNEVNVAAASKATVSADEVVVEGSNVTKIGPGPYADAILADGMWAMLSTLAGMIDAKMPASPGVATGLVESQKQLATSTNVKISR
ncbi:MAG TPA: phage baseplate assembly protein V [Candidatus Bathyarchaeia archaeon]|nr:phage baseplate assembly protein V [Candidatus Bathyarchaeia archaeon]